MNLIVLRDSLNKCILHFRPRTLTRSTSPPPPPPPPHTTPPPPPPPAHQSQRRSHQHTRMHIDMITSELIVIFGHSRAVGVGRVTGLINQPGIGEWD